MTIDDWTQDSVWYNCLPTFEKYGYPLPTRKHFKSLIRGVWRSLGVTREKLRIVAAPWATMYYKGKWIGVSFEVVESLAEHGTDLIFLEKLDIVRVEGKYADKYGIAFVNSRGHLSEYAEDLAGLAEKSGAHVAISGDYDIPGILIIAKLVKKGVLWLGVNEEMMQHFGVSKENKRRVVPYNPKKDRITEDNLKDLVNSHEALRGNVDIEFVKHYKVELDAILAEVGSERLWEYYIMKLEQRYPERDYTRVIEPRPPLDHHYPKAIRAFTRYIDQYKDNITEEEREKIEEELKKVKGFISDVPEKEKEVDRRHGDIIKADEHLKDIADALEDVAGQEGYDLKQFYKELEEEDKKREQEREQQERQGVSGSKREQND